MQRQAKAATVISDNFGCGKRVMFALKFYEHSVELQNKQ